MSKVICEREDIVAIADAVRNKTGLNDEMTIGGIVNGINNISSGGGLGNNTSEWINIKELPSTYLSEPTVNVITKYLEMDSKVIIYILRYKFVSTGGNFFIFVYKNMNTDDEWNTVGGSFATFNIMTEGESEILSISIDADLFNDENKLFYILPIYETFK